MHINEYGFQSSQLMKAIKLLKRAQKTKDSIVLAFTGNMISSGIREYISLLVRNELINAIVTNGAGVEEDIMKTLGHYNYIDFDTDHKALLQSKEYRIGNLSVAHSIYESLDLFLDENFEKALKDPRCDQTPGEISSILGKLTEDRSSYLYWTYKNKIPVYCPTFHDGAIGDYLLEYREEFPDFRLDFLLENVKLSRSLENTSRCGIIIIGGGTSKHFALNNSIMRGGYDWSVVISTAIPYDGSDSGGNFSEAKTWGKLKVKADCVHIFSEATLVFPSLINGGFNLAGLKVDQ